MRLEKFKDALKLAQYELRKNPDNQKIRYALVNIYEQIGNEFRAREVEGDYMLNQGNLIRAKSIYKQLLNNVEDDNEKKVLEEKIEKVKRLEELNKDLEN